MTIPVWAVVVAYNDQAGFRRCVASLAGQSAALEGVFVVDNNASYNVRQILTDMSAGHICQTEIVTPGKNLGSAGGFALGMQTAYQKGAEWVWLHDEDDFPEPHCLEKLLALPAGKIRAPRVMDPQSGKDLLYFKRMRGPLGYFYTAPDKSKVVSTAGTAGLMIHREIIDRIGVYDPRFFVGFEDYDYCLRAGRAGYPVTVVDEAVVYHPDHQSQLSARAGILECVLTHLPSFWGIIRMGSGRDFYTVRNYILLSKRHKSKVIVTLEMLVSLMLLPMFKLADHRVELRTTLKTYLKTLCAG